MGLEAGIDVSSYANADLTWQQMQEIRKSLLNGAGGSDSHDNTHGARERMNICSDSQEEMKEKELTISITKRLDELNTQHTQYRTKINERQNDEKKKRDNRDDRQL